MTKTQRLFSLVMAGCQSAAKARPMRITLLLVFFAVLGGIGMYGAMMGTGWVYNKASNAIAHAFDIKIENVTIVGAGDFDVNETLERNSLQIGAYVTDVTWERMRRDLARNPMIEKATIIRRSPQEVLVSVAMRQPIARLSQQKSEKNLETILVDRSGHKIRVLGETQDKSLMTISGQAAFEQIDEFWPMLMAEPDIAKHVAALRYVGVRRWDMILKSGTIVQLPQMQKSDMGLAMKHLATIIQNKNFDMAKAKTIDLRAQDRLYLRVNSAEKSSDNSGKAAHGTTQNKG